MQEIKLLLTLIGFIVFLILARLFLFFRSFGKELRYINAELKRSGDSERPRWIRARKRLWLSLIPFYNPRKKKKRTHK